MSQTWLSAVGLETLPPFSKCQLGVSWHLGSRRGRWVRDGHMTGFGSRLVIFENVNPNMANVLKWVFVGSRMDHTQHFDGYDSLVGLTLDRDGNA